MVGELTFQRLVDGLAVDDAPRPEHRRLLRQQVLVQFEFARDAGALRPHAHGLNIRSQILRWSALAAAAVVLCVGVGLYLTGGAASIAWGDVQQSIAKAQSMTFSLAVYEGEQLRQDGDVSYLNLNRMRVDSKDVVTVMDYSTGKLLILVPATKHAYLETVQGADKPANCLAQLRKIIGDKDAKEIGDRVIDGKPAKGWQATSAEGTATVWADARTADIVRVELQTGRVRTVISNFRLGVHLDEALFSQSVPSGYQLALRSAYSAHSGTQDDVVLLLRAWAGGNGGAFPDSLFDYAGWSRAAGQYDWSKEKMKIGALNRMISRAFYQLNADPNWVYRGQGVKLGDGAKAIFWRPIKGGKYRVIYGDLRVEEVGKDALPQP